jgi:ketosteroid isomerase-like protein
MYHTIVRRRLRRVFEALDRGDTTPALAAFAPAAEHVFFGAHALAGTRRSPGTRAAWYERLGRVLPGLTFELRSIVVQGPPWRTTAMIEWRDRGHTADGAAYSNQGVHVVEMAWGRVRALRIYCDTRVLEEVLARQARAGVREAVAAPIGEPDLSAASARAAGR